MMPNRFPLQGSLELTGRCNMQCNMCYVRVDKQAIEKSGKRERTAAEWINMAEQIRDAGTLYLLLTGGEITIRPDFSEIYEAIAQMGFVTTVYTNATTVNDQLMSLFEKYPPHTIGVTMYGASSESYRKVCGHASGYDRYVSGLRTLKTLPSILETRTTLIKKNVADYEEMKAFVKRELGEKQKLLVSSEVYNSIRGSVCNPREERLDGKMNAEFFCQKLVELNAKIEDGELKAKDVLNSSELVELERKLKRHAAPPEGGYLFQHCNAGIGSFHISWAGDMYACTMLDQGCTHPFEEGFMAAWDKLPEQYPLAKFHPKCKTCDLQSYCQRCPAFVMAETGTWDSIPEFACDSALRMKQIVEPLFMKAKAL